MGRLVKRGFGPVTERLLAELDGAMRRTIMKVEFSPTAKVQRGLDHKGRNLHAYLARMTTASTLGYSTGFRKAQGAEDGRVCYEELEKFLVVRNQAAVQSLHEGGAELLTFHGLNVPATLNRTFLSTNMIENVMLNFRRHTGRVTKWDPKSDQVERWTSSALLLAEEGFNKICNHRDLPGLVDALGGTRRPLAPGSVPASPLRGAPAAQETASTTPGAKPKRGLQER